MSESRVVYPERDKGVVAGRFPVSESSGGTVSVTELENGQRTDRQKSFCLILDEMAFRDDGSVGRANPGISLKHYC